MREISFEVLVVDNASTDGSASAIAAELPQVGLYALDENTGFAAANNFAARHAQGEYLLLLNPDTVVLDQAVDRIVRFARQHPEAGIFGGRTLDGDGKLDSASCWGRPTLWSTFCRATGLAAFFRNHRLFDPESLGEWARDTVREVDIIVGCFLVLKRGLWQCLGGFDPAFFMYGEEADLCLRAHHLGIKCLFCPEATIIHYGGASEKVPADKMMRLLRAKAQLFARHWSPTAAQFGVAMLRMHAFSRVVAFRVLACARITEAKERFEMWRTVWRSRAQWSTGGSRDVVRAGR